MAKVFLEMLAPVVQIAKTFLEPLHRRCKHFLPRPAAGRHYNDHFGFIPWRDEAAPSCVPGEDIFACYHSRMNYSRNEYFSYSETSD